MRVMVDWWPEWVSIALSLSVTAACAAAFLVVRRAWLRAVLATLAVQGVVLAVLAPIVMNEDGPSGVMAGPGAMSGNVELLAGAPAPRLRGAPYTFFFTRYSFPDDASIHYHSDGTPVAAGPDGSRITLTGAGGWDPVTKRVSGGGRYLVRDRLGKAVVRGGWRPTAFVSFTQLPGWLEGVKELGWQGPAGSASFSAVLKLRVRLDGGVAGVLTAWCTMSDEAKAASGHDWDGFTLVGPGLRFTNFRVNEDRLEGGVMFYGPAST